MWSPYELNNPNGFPPWQGTMGAVSTPKERGLVAAQTDESVANGVTYPGAPSGFTAISVYAFPEYFTWDPNAQVQTWGATIDTPAQMSVDDWTGLVQTAHDELIGVGYDVLAYEIDESPLLNISVPDQICIPNPLTGGNLFCFTPPGAGTTLEVGFAYNIWMLVGSPSSTSGARAQVIAGIGMWDIILFLAKTISVAGIYGLVTGQISLNGLLNQLQGVLLKPGQNIAQAEQPLTSTILILGGLSTALGIFAILHGMQPPPSAPVSVGGTVSGPGGIGIGGNVSTGGTTFAPQQSRSRR